MGRGIPSELADTTKPGCISKVLYIAMFVKTFLNFVESHKCSNPLSMQLKYRTNHKPSLTYYWLLRNQR